MSNAGLITNAVKEFNRISSLSYREMAPFLPKDRPPIAFFCPYVPEELIYAAGGHPLRLMGSPIKISHAQAHLPPYCCHLVKSSLESFLRKELDFLRGIVFSHSCDSMVGLSEIWALQGSLPIHFNLMLPSHLVSERSRSYLRAELKRFQDELVSHVGEITPSKLKASVELFNHIRQALEEIYRRRSRNPSALGAKDFACLLRAGSLMDRPQYLSLLKRVLEAWHEGPKQNGNRIPLYVAGNMTHSDSWFPLIEEAGGIVIWDDLCSGARTFRLMVREDLDPMEALTERYLATSFCPTKYAGPEARMERLWKEVQDSGAKGVIFLLYKYCEAHFFDYPDLRAFFEPKGIPTLLLEVEDPTSSIEQLRMRIQAFVEMLSPL